MYNKNNEQVYAKEATPANGYYQLGADTYGCFYHITYGAIQKDVTKIILFHPREKVPYKRVDIKRFIDDLNDMGFPCYYKLNNDKEIRIELKLEDYKKKTHLTSTLTLLRCLWEGTQISTIPEAYFQILDKDKKVDKFIALQDAHRQVMPYVGHVVTAKTNGNNIDKEEFFKKLAQCAIPIYGNGQDSINNLWSTK